MKIKVNNIDRVLCRLVFCLESNISTEESVLWEMFKISEGGTVSNKEALIIKKEQKIKKALYHKVINSLIKKKLITKNGSIFELNINLSKNNLETLTFIKNENIRS